MFLGRHQLLNREVVIKLHEALAEDSGAAAAFLRASNYLSRLDHPNIVRLYDFGFVNKTAYMAIEYAPLGSLAEHWPRDRATPRWVTRCIELFADLASALRYAHGCEYLDLHGKRQVGVLHGDIKPSNIVLTDDGTAKLTDFMVPALQRVLARNNQGFDIADTSMYGTPRYMPPEQHGGVVTA